MARPGRPRGGDSADTRRRIVDAARAEFAISGFVGASMATIAGSAGLAPSAVYHYFGSKDALYEVVFDDTLAAIWDQVHTAVMAHDTVYANVQSLIQRTNSLSTTMQHYSDFLALSPIEARVHRQFAHLVEQRRKRQDETFGSLAEIGLATGELAGLDQHEATEVLRALIMGWFFESYLNGPQASDDGSSILRLIAALGDR